LPLVKQIRCCIRFRGTLSPSIRVRAVWRVAASLNQISDRWVIGVRNKHGSDSHRSQSHGSDSHRSQSRGSEARTLKTFAGLSSARVRGNTTRPSRTEFFKKFPQPEYTWGAYVRNIPAAGVNVGCVRPKHSRSRSERGVRTSETFPQPE
jgi:hypothetical protein